MRTDAWYRTMRNMRSIDALEMQLGHAHSNAHARAQLAQLKHSADQPIVSQAVTIYHDVNNR